MNVIRCCSDTLLCMIFYKTGTIAVNSEAVLLITICVNKCGANRRDQFSMSIYK